MSKDVQSLLNAAKAKGDPDIERDAKLLAEMYQFCNRVKANSSVQFLPHVKQLTLAYNNAKKSLVKRLDATK